MTKEIYRVPSPEKERKEKISSGEIVVVKIGGSKGIELDLVCQNAAEIHKKGRPIVLIHGGSHETDIIAKNLSHPSEYIQTNKGLVRYTDYETLTIMMMVYCGKINKEIVSRFQRMGVNAVGISGVDGRLLEGRRKESLRITKNGKRLVMHGNFTGKLEKINPQLLQLLLEANFLPVVAPTAVSYEGEPINVDGDRAAAKIAIALGAKKLIILSNIPGVLREYPNEKTLIPRVNLSEIETVMNKYTKGRLPIKLDASREAIEGGVSKVVIGDGRYKNPISKALSGQGTVISSD